MPKTSQLTLAEYVERILPALVEHAQAVWDEFRVPVTRRAISQAFSGRLARRGISCTDLARLLYECPDLHRIRHPRGGDYFLPKRVWNELTPDQRSVLTRRVFNRTIHQEDTKLGLQTVAADNAEVTYVQSPKMEEFLK